MKLYLIITQIFVLGINSLIVPDEIPTILSVIYSNIPILKKGTDSRVGWGFRLGDRADFQFLVELGPQTYTQPLANQEDKNNNKRNTLDNLSNTLYAQRQKDKQQSEISPDSKPGNWLETWSRTVRQRSQPIEQKLPPGAKPGIAIGEIDAKSVIPDDATLKLTELSKVKENSDLDKEKSDTITKLLKLLKENSTIKENKTEIIQEAEQTTAKVTELTTEESESVSELL